MVTPEFKHEPKVCPRCQAVFECKVGSVEQCHCSCVQLDQPVQDYVQKKFVDCLCGACLREMNWEYRLSFFYKRVKS